MVAAAISDIMPKPDGRVMVMRGKIARFGAEREVVSIACGDWIFARDHTGYWLGQEQREGSNAGGWGNVNPDMQYHALGRLVGLAERVSACDCAEKGSVPWCGAWNACLGRRSFVEARAAWGADVTAWRESHDHELSVPTSVRNKVFQGHSRASKKS